MTTVQDRFGPAQSVADAVLYEGYVLYPYRASAPKNRVRWQFGVLMPEQWCRTDPSERSSVRTECLLRPGPLAAVTIRIRFLQRQERTVEMPVADGEDELRFAPVDQFEWEGTTYVAWDEAVDHSVDLGPVALEPLSEPGGEEIHRFVFAGGTETEPIVAADGSMVGREVRRRQEVSGQVRVGAVRARHDGLVRSDRVRREHLDGPGGRGGWP